MTNEYVDPKRRLVTLIAWVALLANAGRLAADDLPEFPPAKVLETDTGISFAILGEKPAAPAPTLFVFGGEMNSSLVNEDVNRLGRLLIPHGYLCVSFDIPCHGTDARTGEKPGGLGAWKTRIVNGENIVNHFCEQGSQVLDYLIAEKFTDPAQIAVSGTSRGGFCAIHFAAAEPRIQQVIAFAPVTHLPALTEFKGAESNPDVLALTPIHVADKLVGKPMWIIIGNQDLRVSTADCLAFALTVIKKSEGKLNPVPVEIRLVGTIDHRLHASPTPQFGQLCAPHDEAATWLLGQRPQE